MRWTGLAGAARALFVARAAVDGRTPLGPPIRRAPLAQYDALFAGTTAREPLPWMAVDLGAMRAIDASASNRSARRSAAGPTAPC